MQMREKIPRNKTILLSEEEKEALRPLLLHSQDIKSTPYQNRIIHGNLFFCIDLLPDEFANLIIIDPPYNLDKDFNGWKFSAKKKKFTSRT